MRKVRRRVGRVNNYIQGKIESGEALHFTLIDPDKVENEEWLRKVASIAANAGTDAFLVGGSIGVSESDVDATVKVLKEFKLPVILFPGNVTGISRFADAILFMSLLNSDDPYFIIGAQVLGAPIVVKYGLEALPTAYIIVGYGGAAGYVGRARPIPYDKPEVGAAYVMTAELLGMKYAYLEAGSGAPKPIPPEFVKTVAKYRNRITLIVGGGIRSKEQARELIKAGANIIVTGTLIEKNPAKVTDIIAAIKRK